MLRNLYINPQNMAQSADGSHLANVTKEEMQEDAATVLDSEEDTVVSMKRKAEEDPDEQRKSVQPVTEDDKSNSADTNNSQYQSCISWSWIDNGLMWNTP